MEKLSRSEEFALLDCASFKAGHYIWKPKTMDKLVAKGLATKTSAGAYVLTEAGYGVVSALRAR